MPIVLCLNIRSTQTSLLSHWIEGNAGACDVVYAVLLHEIYEDIS